MTISVGLDAFNTRMISQDKFQRHDISASLSTVLFTDFTRSQPCNYMSAALEQDATRCEPGTFWMPDAKFGSIYGQGIAVSSISDAKATEIVPDEQEREQALAFLCNEFES